MTTRPQFNHPHIRGSSSTGPFLPPARASSPSVPVKLAPVDANSLRPLLVFLALQFPPRFPSPFPLAFLVVLFFAYESCNDGALFGHDSMRNIIFPLPVTTKFHSPNSVAFTSGFFSLLLRYTISSYCIPHLGG